MTPKFDELLLWYETLAPHTLAHIPSLYSERARFRDPFNDVQGHAGVTAIFTHMFATTQQPRFVIEERMLQGAYAFVSWQFHFILRGKPFTIEGVSQIHFGEDGRVVWHRDYWDPAEDLFQKLPVIGGLVAWLRRRFVATGP